MALDFAFFRLNNYLTSTGERTALNVLRARLFGHRQLARRPAVIF